MRPSRAELGRRPLHRGLGTVAPLLLSLALHAGAAWGWWQVVIVTPAELDGIRPSSAYADALPSLVDADRSERGLATVGQVTLRWEASANAPSRSRPPSREGLRDAPHFTPPEFPAAELPDEPLPEPLVPFVPDVIWFDEPFEGMPAFAIRARRPAPVEAQAEPPATLAAAEPMPAPPAPEPAEAPRPAPVAATTPPVPAPDTAPRPTPDAPAPSAASSAGGEVVDARPASDNRPPRYPSLARRRGWEGRVVLAVDLTAEGTVTAVRVLRSSGHEVLDEAAREAVAGWRFAPATRDGVAMAHETEVSIRFSLTD